MLPEVPQHVRSYLPLQPGQPPSFSDNLRFREDLEMDETDFFALVIRLENLYHVRIPDVELEQVETVQELINCFLTQLAEDLPHRF